MRSKTDIRFTVDADIDQVMNALLAVERFGEWATFYRNVRTGPRDPEGRPRRVFVTAEFMGSVDDQVLEFSWEPDRVSWTVVDSSRGSKGTSSFELFAVDEGTEIDYHEEMRLPLPIPGVLFNRTLRRAAEEAAANFADFVQQFPGVGGYAVG
ncbi:SRPBCC family protein [Nocardia sp. SSK8]|uniref:SRPBCC family protein n=1 Tax=Nocardia sp. SSK8 TaxID=3120154 RepID=UPI00300BD454